MSNLLDNPASSAGLCAVEAPSNFHAMRSLLRLALEGLRHGRRGGEPGPGRLYKYQGQSLDLDHKVSRVPSRPKVLQKKFFTKRIFGGKTFCNYYKSTVHSARKRPQRYYKNNCFRELFCNNFGQDGMHRPGDRCIWVHRSSQSSLCEANPFPNLRIPSEASADEKEKYGYPGDLDARTLLRPPSPAKSKPASPYNSNEQPAKRQKVSPTLMERSSESALKDVESQLRQSRADTRRLRQERNALQETVDRLRAERSQLRHEKDALMLVLRLNR